MHVSRKLLIPAPSPDIGIFVTRTTYTSATGTALLQEHGELVASDTCGKFFVRHSADNGAAWSTPQLCAHEKLVEGGTLRSGEFCLLYEPAHDRIFRFVNHSLYPAGDRHTSAVIAHTATWIEVSTDGGRSFAPAHQLIVEGGDKVAWAPGVRYGKNSIGVSFCSPFVDREGTIVLPVRWAPVLPPDHEGHCYMEALCLLGTVAANGDVTWTAGNRLGIDPSLSSRGLCEPAVTELPDGRFFMVARGSNVGFSDTPSRKWISVSEDRGRTWSPARPFSYEDGELFFSPATGSQLLRSQRNGTLYWIGNILPENPHGNNPRYPLCIAEVDEATLSLRKDTVFNVDNRTDEDTPRLQLSNFHVYEDRETGEFVLIMERVFERSENSLGGPAYEYRIAV